MSLLLPHHQGVIVSVISSFGEIGDLGPGLQAYVFSLGAKEQDTSYVIWCVSAAFCASSTFPRHALGVDYAFFSSLFVTP
jgi:hypothetical protein